MNAKIRFARALGTLSLALFKARDAATDACRNVEDRLSILGNAIVDAEVDKAQAAVYKAINEADMAVCRAEDLVEEAQLYLSEKRAERDALSQSLFSDLRAAREAVENAAYYSK